MAGVSIPATLSLHPLSFCALVMYLRDLIADISPPTNLAMPDTLAWSGSHDGLFSIKSAYNHITFGLDLPADPLFCLIWRWKGIERVKVFLWQVVMDAIPTKFLHFSRHVLDDPICSRCNSNLHETSIHVLRDCDVAGAFWSHLISAENYRQFLKSNTRSWIQWNLTSSSYFLAFPWP